MQASEESEWFDEHKEEQVLDRYTLLAFFDSNNAQCMHTMEHEVTPLLSPLLPFSPSSRISQSHYNTFYPFSYIVHPTTLPLDTINTPTNTPN